MEHDGDSCSRVLVDRSRSDGVSPRGRHCLQWIDGDCHRRLIADRCRLQQTNGDGCSCLDTDPLGAELRNSIHKNKVDWHRGEQCKQPRT